MIPIDILDIIYRYLHKDRLLDVHAQLVDNTLHIFWYGNPCYFDVCYRHCNGCGSWVIGLRIDCDKRMLKCDCCMIRYE